MTPFGMPVVPPVYIMTKSSGEEAGSGAATVARASVKGVAHAGQGPVPSSTWR